MKVRTILIGVVIFLLVANISFAGNLTVDLVVTPDEVWLRVVEGQNYPDPTVSISATCYDGGLDVTENATWEISLYDSSSGLKKGDDKSSTSFTLDNEWAFGDYKVEAKCEDGNKTNTTEETLEVHKLELYLKENSAEAYVGDELVIPLGFKVDSSIESFMNADYGLKIGSSTVSINKANIVLNGDTLNIKIPLDLGFSEGYKNLELTITYEDQELKISKNNFIYLKSPLTIAATTSSVTCMANEICEIDLDLKVYYYGIGSIEDFDEDNFRVGVFDKDNDIIEYADISKITCNSDTKSCKLSLLIPELDPNDYILSIKAERIGYKSTINVPLTSVLSLGGEIIDASGKGVQVSMTFKNKNNGKISKIDSSGGTYGINIVPGDYEISANFGSGTLLVDIFNVTFGSEIIEYGSNINFDSFTGTSPIIGVHVTKVVVLEFGYEFEDSVLTIPYEGNNVNDEDNLKIYRCEKWNFAKRRCNGEWELVESRVYPIPDVVKVNTTKFGAFVLGEQKFLHFNIAGTNKNIIYLGDTIPVEGQVLDSDGVEIESVTITLKVENYTSNTTTLSDGSFLGYVTLPYKESTFELEINADKEPFLPATKKQVIKTTKRKEISMLFPETTSVNLDESKIIDLLVINNGQVNLREVNILVNGISLKNYKLVPSRVSKLEPGEQREIKMNIDISSEDCGEKCQQYYLIGIEVKAKTETNEEISGGGSFTVELKKPVEKVEESGGLFSGISGMLIIPSISTNNLIAGTIAVVIIVLLVLIIKKKKNKMPFYGRNYNFKKVNIPRNNVISSMSYIKSQIRDKK